MTKGTFPVFFEIVESVAHAFGEGVYSEKVLQVFIQIVDAAGIIEVHREDMYGIKSLPYPWRERRGYTTLRSAHR